MCPLALNLIISPLALSFKGEKWTVASCKGKMKHLETHTYHCADKWLVRSQLQGGHELRVTQTF